MKREFKHFYTGLGEKGEWKKNKKRQTNKQTKNPLMVTDTSVVFREGKGVGGGRR